MFAWMNFLLAITQSTITHLAAGPEIVGGDFGHLSEPLDPPSLCHSQRMGAPDGYSNISVLGSAVIITLSTIFIVANLTLVPVLKILHRRNPRRFPLVGLWTADGMLQVLQKAYERVGVTNWSAKDTDVPIIDGNPPIPAFSIRKKATDEEAGVATTGGAGYLSLPQTEPPFVTCGIASARRYKTY